MAKRLGWESMIGKIYGKWLVLDVLKERSKNGKVQLLCECTCELKNNELAYIDLKDIDEVYVEYLQNCFNLCETCGRYGSIECVGKGEFEFSVRELGLWNIDEILEDRR